MFSKAKNSKKQGDIGLGAAIDYFSRNNYTVCIPLTDSQEYDLVVDNGTLFKVLVKTTTRRIKNRPGAYRFGLRTLGGNRSFHTVKKFDKEKVDLLFVLTDEGRKYLIPTISINVKNELILNSTYDPNIVQ